LKHVKKAHGLIAIVMLFALAAHGADKNDKDKAKQPAGRLVDSGSFAVMVKGQRVATETFTVQQENGASTVKAQVKETAGESPSHQSSEMQITASGALIRYEWDQLTPSTGSLVVTPSNEFLLEKITTATSAKPAEQPFLMPNTSSILDNNFFIHREVLLWRYLASAPCRDEGGNRKCDSADFGVLVPQDRTSMRVRVALVGKEKISVRGGDRELLRLNLTGEGFAWALWVDDHDQFKLMRVSIPADNTEIVRD
jgi:hypothetical protein